ncbi:lysylphosphatidylglycerol synthase transmembrane domain-containing protein [Aneurinibacillus terranovensis]|uniref:lysylphosphatidylglycerol synthase transmembrane domain-containing protein n=1 Tax=Aneurinibacillus terranovensis TaxID=278991 RepID=UPI00040FD5DB|nr:lysylphosphatidylglycerol synthase transmembrane domain-containing protein [Aneurinibacillus terranovensis]
MKGKYIQLAIGCALTCIFFYLAYREIGPLDIVRIFEYPIHYLYVILAIFAFMVSQYFRALSWSRGMAPNIGTKRMFASVCMGNGSNMLLPFRMGEAVRILTVSQSEKRFYAIAGINLLIERLLDVAILMLLALMVAFFVPFESAVQVKLSLIRHIMLLGVACGSIALFILLRFRHSEVLVNRLPDKVKKLLSFFNGFVILQSPFVFMRTFFYLVCSWGCVYLSTVLGLKAVGLDNGVSLLASLVVIVMTNLIMLIPSAPGGIGVFQYGCTYALSLFHISALQMAILAVLLHLIQYAALLPLSLFFFFRGEFTIKSFFKRVLSQGTRF